MMDMQKVADLVSKLHRADDPIDGKIHLSVEDRELLREMERIIYQMEDIEKFTEHDVNLDDAPLDILNGIRSIRQGETHGSVVKRLQKNRKDRASQEMIEKLLNPKLIIPPGPPLRPGRYVAVKSPDGTEMHLQRPRESKPVEERDYDVSFRGLLTELNSDFATYTFGENGQIMVGQEFFTDQLGRKGTINVDVKGFPK